MAVRLEQGLAVTCGQDMVQKTVVVMFSTQEMVLELLKLSRQDHSALDCCIVVILSHGCQVGLSYLSPLCSMAWERVNSLSCGLTQGGREVVCQNLVLPLQYISKSYTLILG